MSVCVDRGWGFDYTTGNNDYVTEITNFFFNFLERTDVRVLQLEETFERIFFLQLTHWI
jgi:hypothetical protein